MFKQIYSHKMIFGVITKNIPLSRKMGQESLVSHKQKTSCVYTSLKQRNQHFN